VRARDYTILARAVEEGVAAGWRRAHKHTAKPPEDHVRAAIEEAVLGEIAEVFTFDETSGDAPQSDRSSTERGSHLAPSPEISCTPSIGAAGVPDVTRGSRRGRVQGKK
jgi:hypothetical protein